MDMIKPHETHSGGILANAGYPVESEIAARHHNYDGKTSEHPLAVSVLHMNVDLSDMLHIADVTQALRSGERTYKGSFSQAKMMRVIAEHAEEGKVSLLAAYLWLTDDLRKYEAKPPMDAKEREQDERHLAFVRAFLAHAEEEVQVLEAA